MVTFRPPGNEVNGQSSSFACFQVTSSIPPVWAGCRCFAQSLELPFGSVRHMQTSQELQAFGSSLCAALVVNHWRLPVGGIAWQTAFLPFRLLPEFFCLLTRTCAFKKPHKNNNLSAIWHLKPYFNFWVQLFLWTYCEIPVCYPSAPTWCLQGWVL